MFHFQFYLFNKFTVNFDCVLCFLNKNTFLKKIQTACIYTYVCIQFTLSWATWSHVCSYWCGAILMTDRCHACARSDAVAKGPWPCVQNKHWYKSDTQKKKHTQYDLHPSSPVLWQNAFCNVKAGTDPLVAELFVSFSTVQGASCRKTEREWSSDRRGMCSLTRRPMPCSADIKSELWKLCFL